jgi:signal peptidase I
MNEKAKKIADYAFKTIWWVVFITLFLLVFSIITAKMKGEVPKVFGYSVLTITTPSMGETIPVDTYILVKETSPEQIKEEDIICFYSDDSGIYGYPNTHRVKRVIEVEGGYEYVTKGDANAMEDSVTAKSDRLIGRYVKTLDGVTWLSKAVASKGMILIFGFMFVATGIAVVMTAKLKAQDELKEKEKR